MDEQVVKQALLDAATAILDEAGIEVDVTTGTISWPDPTVVPYERRMIEPDRLMKLGRAVHAGRLCFGQRKEKTVP